MEIYGNETPMPASYTPEVFAQKAAKQEIEAEYTHIGIVSGHKSYRKKVANMLKDRTALEYMGEYCSAKKLSVLRHYHQPFILLFDIDHPIPGCKKVLRGIARNNLFEHKIIAITECYSKSFAPYLEKLGFSGMIPRLLSRKSLRKEITFINASKGFYFRTALMGLQPSNPVELPPYSFTSSCEVLTSKELRILQMTCLEHSNEAIALELELSHRTIETYRSKIREKLQVKSFNGAVTYAVSHDLIKVRC